MKKICLIPLFIITPLFGFHADAQYTDIWIRQSGFTAHLWPSFVYLEKTTPVVDLTQYRIISSDDIPGVLQLDNCSLSKEQALSIALMIIGGIYEMRRYRISMDKPNVIPYKDGAIVYGYWKAKKYWELFNISTSIIHLRYPYRIFSVSKK